MVDAAVVGKAKAKKAFEKEVRSGGPTAVLIEHSAGPSVRRRHRIMTIGYSPFAPLPPPPDVYILPFTPLSGNVYKTRIWPLEPGVQKTIQITWSSSVASDDSASSAASVAVEDRSAGWKAGLGTLPSNLLRDTLVWLNAQEMFPAARSCRALWRSVASGLLVVPLPYGGGVASSLSVELNLNSNRARKDVATPSWGLPLLANDAAATAGGAADDENKNTLRFVFLPNLKTKYYFPCHVCTCAPFIFSPPLPRPPRHFSLDVLFSARTSMRRQSRPTPPLAKVRYAWRSASHNSSAPLLFS